MPAPVFLTAAIVGAEITREQTPFCPTRLQRSGGRPRKRRRVRRPGDFGAGLFLNPVSQVELFAAAMRERGIKPEIEVFEGGHGRGALRPVDRDLLTLPLHFNFVPGVAGRVAGDGAPGRGAGAAGGLGDGGARAAASGELSPTVRHPPTRLGDLTAT